MTRITLNEAGIHRMVDSPTGGIGRELRRRAEAIEDIARLNASGGWLNTQTGDLLSHLQTREHHGPEGIFFTVGSDSEHRGFRYPGFQDENGHPWLTEAVADVFPQMAGTGPADAHALAIEVLEATVEALDTIPVFGPAFVGAPARSFVSPGKPAYDCCETGQLTVHIQPVSEGAHAPGLVRSSQTRINRVAFNIIILRCIQTDPEGPVPAEAQAVAAQINRDGWAIWNHLWNLQREGGLFYQCGDVIWGQLTSIPAQGTCGGWTLTVTAALDGYEEVFGT